MPNLFFVNFGLFKHAIQFLQQINGEIVSPVYGTGMQTHILQNMNLLP